MSRFAGGRSCGVESEDPNADSGGRNELKQKASPLFRLILKTDPNKKTKLNEELIVKT